MTYVLDTDICSYLMKRTHPVLIERVKGFEPLRRTAGFIAGETPALHWTDGSFERSITAIHLTAGFNRGSIPAMQSMTGAFGW